MTLFIPCATIRLHGRCVGGHFVLREEVMRIMEYITELRKLIQALASLIRAIKTK
ncbi:MAG: hypothetical protein FWG36_04605 [Oscillospiraceae bacterium]|nr:hypothetical protein [Oscillospiraceae bacterium]